MVSKPTFHWPFLLSKCWFTCHPTTWCNC